VPSPSSRRRKPPARRLPTPISVPRARSRANEHVDDLDVHLVEFANGVRLNLKKTDFEANTIHVNIRVGSGRLTEPATEPGLAFLANLAFITGGLGKHNIDDLQRLFAGKTVGLNFNVRDDACTLGGTTNRDDLPAQLQLLTAYLVDPGYRPEALRQGRKIIEQMYTRFAHTPSGPMQTEVPRLLASDDPRFGLPAQKVVQNRTLEEVRAWLARSWPAAPLRSPSWATSTSTPPSRPWRRPSARCPHARPNPVSPRRGW